MAIQDDKFSSKDELKNWLKHRGVSEDSANKSADILFEKGANRSTMLIGISSEQLEKLGVQTLPSIELMNKLKDQENVDEAMTVTPTAIEVDVSCCRLGRQFLRSKNLPDFVEAGDRCMNQDETKLFINKLREISKKADEFTALFGCIFTSSGTGKTQLAATVSMTTYGAVYFYMSAGGEMATRQAFYRPHSEFSKILFQAIKEYASSFEGEYPGASDIAMSIEKMDENGQSFSCDLIELISKAFFPSVEAPLDIVSFRKAWREIDADKRPLVFLDEVPSKDDCPQAFTHTILFRDILRALGIYPILMSTHTGAQNALQRGSDSRGSEFTEWSHVFTRLPPYAPPNPFSQFQLSTERPLVACLMDRKKESNSLTEIVERVQEFLYRSKPNAWRKTPVFQLCQLFRSCGGSDGDKIWHQIVGEHFGHFKSYSQQPDDPFSGVGVSRIDAPDWRCLVGMVAPEEEPILFLALLSWSTKKRVYFPLQDKFGTAISVREAFEKTSENFPDSKLHIPSSESNRQGDDSADTVSRKQ